jgi:hypothetical protein
MQRRLRRQGRAEVGVTARAQLQREGCEPRPADDWLLGLPCQPCELLFAHSTPPPWRISRDPRNSGSVTSILQRGAIYT